MTEEAKDLVEVIVPTQEVIEHFHKKIEDARKEAVHEKQINDRMLLIVGKVDAIYRGCYKLDNSHMLYYSYEWLSDKTITFVVQSKVLNTAGKIPGSLPLSAVWNETDLHIGLEMLSTDIYEEKTQLKKLIEEQKANGTFSYNNSLQRRGKFWAKIKRWFSF